MVGHKWFARVSTSLIVVSCVAVLASCASGPVKLEDKDDTGRFDGVWSAAVDGPRATREELPGSWYANCDWEPYTLTFRVSDGMINRSGGEEKTPVSVDGEFRLTTRYKRAGIDSYDRVYRGTLNEESGSGRYEQVHSGYGATGCSASVNFDRT